MKKSKDANRYKLKNTKWGFKAVSPLPETITLSHFYKKDYYKKLLKEGKTREAKLIHKDANIRDEELAWVRSTYFADRLFYLRSFIGTAKKKTILDVGCGTGEFLQFMKKHTWSVHGIEPSYEAWISAHKKEKNIFNISLEDFDADKRYTNAFDAVALFNVLEHIPHPDKVIAIAKRLLKKRGVLMIQVPNDFNVLQDMANTLVQKKNWWVTIPDHINYFNFGTLTRLLSQSGFRIRLKTTDFPMEMFLLLGENYIDNKELGSVCHKKRIYFESQMTADARRKFYATLASFSLGRQCIIYAQKI